MTTQAANTDSDDETAAGSELLAKVNSLRGSRCSECRALLCGHELLFAIAMGYGRLPQCLACLSRASGQTRGQLRDQLAAHFQHRHCYARVWRHESELERMTDLTQPSCLWPLAGGHTVAGPAEGQTRFPQAGAAGSTGTSGGSRRPLRLPDTEWQAGGLACGDLLLLLRATMNKLPPRSVLRLVATDAGAAEDIPAWCRLTGHQLLWAQHPEFYIQRRD